ncbi:hypothetical protein [Microbacterium sp. G2-8]|uniref:hypothetical protein n=1 Tax=Microbacterium sp. G2-8 TaxID=2842454 RepID=UPI001C8AFC21|nr:hypothetical protein [Microbacterium sp. G2-8]
MVHRHGRRAVATAAALLVGAGLLAACTTPVPTVSEPSSPDPTASTPATADIITPTPTSEPDTRRDDPEDPDSWVITEQGIGPVDVGADFDSAIDDIKTTNVGPLCDGVAYGAASDNAYDILVIKDRYDGTDEIVEVSIGWNGDTMGVGPRTEEGLGLGSTKSEVLSTYDDAAEVASVIQGRSFVAVAEGDVDMTFTYVEGYDGAVSVSVLSGEEPAYEACA